VAGRVLVRAFDKAVRRKPLAFAADAVGLRELHVAEEGCGRREVVSESNDRAVGEMFQGACIDHERREAWNVSVPRQTSR
jgi:hypothetical protein